MHKVIFGEKQSASPISSNQEIVSNDDKKSQTS